MVLLTWVSDVMVYSDIYLGMSPIQNGGLY